MRVVKLLLILPVIFMALPARAADAKSGASVGDEAQPEHAEQQTDEVPTDAAERPQREAVRMSPSIRKSPPRPDESGKMRRVAPPRADSPLQHVPALKDNMPPPRGGKAPADR